MQAPSRAAGGPRAWSLAPGRAGAAGRRSAAWEGRAPWRHRRGGALTTLARLCSYDTKGRGHITFPEFLHQLGITYSADVHRPYAEDRSNFMGHFTKPLPQEPPREQRPEQRPAPPPGTDTATATAEPAR